MIQDQIEDIKAAVNNENTEAAVIKEIYENNEQFKEYVMKYIRNSGDTIEQALRKKIIRAIAKEYEPGGINHRKENQDGISTK